MADTFTIAFGSALALHREGGQVYVVVQGKKHPITTAQADLIGDDFHRTAKTAREWKAPSPEPEFGRLGGETYGDD